MRSEKNFAADPFSVIYIEEEVWDHPRTKDVLSHFPHAVRVPVRRYQDLFDRTRQSYRIQQDSRALILAAKHGTHVYSGAPVCQNFDERWFYYCCTSMNCVYDCSYCWLKGMYAGAAVTAFVNLEDFFAETEALLKEHPVYLCIAYESDLAALEPVLHHIREWHAFAEKHPDLTIEVRTKCARTDIWQQLSASSRMIPAFTLSPDPVIRMMENGTPSLHERLKAAAFCLDQGYPVRLCFDPLLCIPDADDIYREMIREVSSVIDLGRIRDAGIGTFRMSASYLKNMRRRFPDQAVVQYPYETSQGYCHYPRNLIEHLEKTVRSELEKHMPAGRIYEEIAL